MSNVLTFWLYKRNSKEFSFQESPVRLHKFSETPQLLSLPKNLKKQRPKLPNSKISHLTSSLNKHQMPKEVFFEAKAVKIFKQNQLYRDARKSNLLPPIKKQISPVLLEESEDEDKTVQDFLKQWNYL